MPNRSAKAGAALGLLVALLCASAIHAPAQTSALTTIYNFSAGSSSGTNTDGGGPSGLIQASDGNLYGTCGGGGANGTGTIFKITPSGAYTLLYTFSALSNGLPGTNSDGAVPAEGLIQASDGNLYGTCRDGGANGLGTIFKITTGGTFTALHSFSDGTDGAIPWAGLIQASDGNLYGTCRDGGVKGDGTIYKITLSGAFTTLYSFTGGTDGMQPWGDMIQASNGNLYGTTFLGGANGSGAVFKITLSGAFTTLYSFTGGPDGAYPWGLIQASDGNLYGICLFDGANGAGTIYKLTLSGAFKTLHSFDTSGSETSDTLIQASNGNLYGTTSESYGDGTIFRMTLKGAFTTLHSFSGPDGAGPTGLIEASDGTLYGTTGGGGANGTGTIYALDTIPPTLASLSPSSANAAGPAFTLILKGADFSSTDSVHWTQGATTTNLSTTYVSASELKAQVPASLIAAPGKATVSVVTSAGLASHARSFTIEVTTLRLTSAALTKTSTGAYTAKIKLKNVGYLSAANVSLTSASLGAATASTTLPVSLGTLAAGASTSVTLSFPSSTGSSGTTVSLKVAGTFTGGTFSGALKVTLP